MKKICLLLFSVFTASVLLAQTSSFGLKGGLNLASTTGNDFRTGFHAGALAHLHMGRTWALQPEVVYSSQGAEYRAGNNEYKLKTDYLNVPFLFQYFAAPGLRLQTGPQVGFLLNLDDGANNLFVDKTEYKDIDLSWAFGASYITRTGLGIDGRHNLGLLNNNNSSVPGTTKNSVIQVGLFYQFSGR